MKSKCLSVLLALAIAVGALSGCNGMKNKKEAVTLTIKVPTLTLNSVANPEVSDSKTFMEMAGAEFASQYKEADVTVDVKVFDYVDEKAAVTGSFDTDYAPDVLFEDYFNMAAYVHTGRVVPLDDIITEDIRADISDTSWEMSMSEGKTYMMPYLSRQNVLIYNKKYMRECGLEKYIPDKTEIQSWSTEEWTEILDTLADKLPEGVYPMVMYAKNNQGDTHIMSMIRAFGSTIFDDEGNFDFESPEAVKALTWIRSGVDKGWYAPHCENLEITDAQELFNNNQLVFYVFNNANVVLYDNLDDYGYVNFPGGVATSFATGFEVFDNGDEAKVRVAKDFVKYIYENDKWLELSAGNIPESKRVAEKYKDKIVMLDSFTENAENVVDFMNNSPNWQGTDTSVRSVFWCSINKLLLGVYTPEECAKQLDLDCNKALEIGRETSVLHQ